MTPDHVSPSPSARPARLAESVREAINSLGYSDAEGLVTAGEGLERTDSRSYLWHDLRDKVGLDAAFFHDGVALDRDHPHPRTRHLTPKIIKYLNSYCRPGSAVCAAVSGERAGKQSLTLMVGGGVSFSFPAMVATTTWGEQVTAELDDIEKLTEE